MILIQPTHGSQHFHPIARAFEIGHAGLEDLAMTAPTPATTPPAFSMSRMAPDAASPLARKSSIISTRWPLGRNLAFTVSWKGAFLVKENTSV